MMGFPRRLYTAISILLAYLFLRSIVKEVQCEVEQKEGLRSFLMNYLDMDRRSCSVTSLKEIIIGNVKTDSSGFYFWNGNCPSFESGGNRRGFPSPNATNISKAQQEKLDQLLKDTKCRPTKMWVSVGSPDASHRYFPCQVAVKRCTGCCNSPLMQCIPTKKRKRKFPVMTLGVSQENANKYSIPDKDLIKTLEFEEHKQCVCKCKIKSSDCSPTQKYNKSKCQCFCPKTKKKCSSRKVWSKEECACVCSQETECSTGLEFSPSSCRCEKADKYLNGIDYVSL